MKVLVAGATGAIGNPLVRRLVERNHEVVAFSRRAAGDDALRRLGARPVRCDALDPAAVKRIVDEERPGAVVSQLTKLPREFTPRRLAEAYADNNRVRFEGTRNLLRASEEAGVSRFVIQASAFWYRPTPGDVKTEEDALWEDAPEPMGEAVRTMRRTEEMTLAAHGPKPAVLRYATFYGPGTWFAPDGVVGRLVARRKYPILGDGRAVSSFVHVDDAAAATVAAVERPLRGVFNVADDEPAPARDWMSGLAQALGAPAPRRVPSWVGRLAIGKGLVEYTLNTRGAANARARQELAWKPGYPSWRVGFHEGLGDRER